MGALCPEWAPEPINPTISHRNGTRPIAAIQPEFVPLPFRANVDLRGIKPRVALEDELALG